MEFISSQCAQHPSLASKYEKLSDLYNQKLWHQLSQALSEFISEEANCVGDNLHLLYTEFIAHFEARLNQVELSILVSKIGHSFQEPEKALNLFEEVLKSRTRLGAEATVCLEMDICLVRLRMNQVDDVKKILEGTKENISTIASSETIVFSKYHKATAEYLKIVGPSQEFYKSALMFLAYTPVEELAVEERITLATDMALAAVTGDDIFNFGEVLATPILDSLKGTDSQWLHDLVMSLHHGSINEFNSVVDKYREKYFEQPALSSKNEEVKKKVVLLALMNIAFERSANDRQISFTDIAARTCIDVTQVEWVVMRAMSLGLIKGTMDQVDQSVNVTWIQPRILDKEQLSVIGEQLDIWAGSVKETLADVTDQAQEILV